MTKNIWKQPRHSREGGNPALVDALTFAYHCHEMHEAKHPAVYIMADRYRGTIYIGVTSALWNRVVIHKQGLYDGFTKNYGLKTLVWYEHHHTMELSIKREKQLKKWNRSWKFRIIEAMNADWNDLHDHIDVTATLVEPQAGSPPARG